MSIAEGRIEQLDIRITPSSFSKCWVDIGRVVNQDILKMYPKLNDWVEFQSWEGKYDDPQKAITNSSVIKYIVAMYDENSPFVTMGLQYHDRKLCSAEYAKLPWDKEDGSFHPSSRKIMAGKEPVVLKMIIRYCALSRGFEYATYMAIERSYHENTLTENPIDIAKIAKEEKVLKEKRDSLLAGDTSPELQKELFRMVSEEELAVRKLRVEYRVVHYKSKFPEYLKAVV